MFWIFANDENNSLAPYNTALGTTFANGGRNFHNSISLLVTVFLTVKVFNYTGHSSICLHFTVVLPAFGSQDSQDEGFTFGDGNCMFKMRRQRTICRNNRPLVRQDAGFVRPDQYHWFEGNGQARAE